MRAVTVWPFVIYEGEAGDEPCLRVHEWYHWTDQLRWLVLPWFVVYLAR